MTFEGKYHAFDFLSMNAWNASEVSSSISYHMIVSVSGEFKKHVITNNTVSSVKEFAVEPIFGDEMGGKEKVRGEREGKRKRGKQTHQTPNVEFLL